MKTIKINLTMAMACAVLVTGSSAFASDAYVRHDSGEITWVDLKDGKLQMRSDVPQDKGDIFEYRITAHETRVTDPAEIERAHV